MLHEIFRRVEYYPHYAWDVHNFRIIARSIASNTALHWYEIPI